MRASVVCTRRITVIGRIVVPGNLMEHDSIVMKTGVIRLLTKSSVTRFILLTQVLDNTDSRS